jgi:hypothetical protein
MLSMPSPGFAHFLRRGDAYGSKEDSALANQIG